MRSLFADVILPLPLAGAFTYEIPADMEENVAVGKRVEVPFGRKKHYAAIVYKTHSERPLHTIKKIIQVLDEAPVVTDDQLRFWEWISDYYVCHLGEVMHAALPSAMRLGSETRIILSRDLNGDYTELNDDEYHTIQVLEQRELELQEIADLLGKRSVYPMVQSLMERGIVQVSENLKQGYTPRTIPHLRVAEAFQDENALEEALQTLNRAPKQQELVLATLDMSEEGAVSKKALLRKTGASAAVLKSLTEKGILETYEVNTSRLEDVGDPSWDLAKLTSEQEKALDQIETSFNDKEVTLLHGVTSSGKTHVYMQLMADAVKEGKQVLYLLPEIALTYQIVQRLRVTFGNLLGVYHSRFSANERVEVWNRVRDGEYRIVVGARSSVMLPFKELGLVIVDEEHDQSLKQFDPSPRYHARDAAIFLAQKAGAKTLLGSGTPSLESFTNTRTEKYGLVKMMKRYGKMPLPAIEVANVKEATRKKLMKSHFTPELLAHLDEALANKEQAIIFQNRRGFAPYMLCHDCDWVPRCKNCDVSLTYHKVSHYLKCHYCGYTADPIHSCGDCGSTDIHIHGLGTEQVEEELQLLYPNATIARLDLDSARSRKNLERIISGFEQGLTDILVGTQMVTKGLDFDNVSVVGILSTDQLLNHPHFRAHERGYQLMEQVSGRSGRKKKQGTVVLQATQVGEPILQYVIAHDFQGFYDREMEHRRVFAYPPYSRLIQLTLRHRDAEVVNKASNWMAEELRKKVAGRVMGPALPPVARIRNQYYRDILLKLERNSTHIKQAKYDVRELTSMLAQTPGMKGVQVHVNVDP